MVGPRGHLQGRGSKQNDSVNVSRSEWHISLPSVSIGFVVFRGRTLLLQVKRKENHWCDSWKTQFLDKAQDDNISWNIFEVEWACVHGKRYVECKSLQQWYHT